MILNVAIALYQEHSAEKALAALKAMTVQTVTVVREGKTQTIAAADLVRGDLMLLKAGDAVAADARLIHSQDLETDEAVLTGESSAVAKSAAPLTEVPDDLGDAVNRLFPVRQLPVEKPALLSPPPVCRPSWEKLHHY